MTESHKVTTFVYFRHEESMLNARRICAGQTGDEGLTELGRRRALESSEEIHRRFPNITIVASSPLPRARQTAQAIFPEVSAEIHDGLIEQFVGTIPESTLQTRHDFDEMLLAQIQGLTEKVSVKNLAQVVFEYDGQTFRIIDTYGIDESDDSDKDNIVKSIIGFYARDI